MFSIPKRPAFGKWGAFVRWSWGGAFGHSRSVLFERQKTLERGTTRKARISPRGSTYLGHFVTFRNDTLKESMKLEPECAFGRKAISFERYFAARFSKHRGLCQVPLTLSTRARTMHFLLVFFSLSQKITKIRSRQRASELLLSSPKLTKVAFDWLLDSLAKTGDARAAARSLFVCEISRGRTSQRMLCLYTVLKCPLENVAFFSFNTDRSDESLLRVLPDAALYPRAALWDLASATIESLWILGMQDESTQVQRDDLSRISWLKTRL